MISVGWSISVAVSGGLGRQSVYTCTILHWLLLRYGGSFGSMGLAQSAIGGRIGQAGATRTVHPAHPGRAGARVQAQWALL